MLNLTEGMISNLLSSGESETVEFKERFSDEALETIGAFSNAQGGVLIIGVKDCGHICGVDLGKKTLEDIANRIQDATDPRLQPAISTNRVKTGNLVIIYVTSSIGVPVSIRGRYFKRLGKTNQRMSHEEIMQRMITSTGLSWDAIIEASLSLKELDVDRINRFIDSIKNKGRLSIPLQASGIEVLRKLELIKNELPTRAALLLFSNNPESFFSSAFLKVGRFRSATHIVDDREIHGSLIEQIDGAMNWFKDRLATEFIITGTPERDVVWEYPLGAIREAVINAICHRDYASLAHTQIRLYDDRLEIWNAGNLPHALSPESLLHDHDSIPRNRKIAEAFFYAGFIERWGSGTLRMAEELQASGLSRPEFESTNGHFRLVFRKLEISQYSSTKLTASERHLKVIDYLKEHKTISNTEYQSLTGVSKRTATRDLNNLKEQGILIFEGLTGRGIVYRLKEK